MKLHIHTQETEYTYLQDGYNIGNLHKPMEIPDHVLYRPRVLLLFTLRPALRKTHTIYCHSCNLGIVGGQMLTTQGNLNVAILLQSVIRRSCAVHVYK